MGLVTTFFGTVLMMAGALLLLCGLGLSRATQAGLGRLYLVMTSTGGTDEPDRGLMRFLADLRGNDPLKKRRGLQIACLGLALGLLGAALARL